MTALLPLLVAGPLLAAFVAARLGSRHTARRAVGLTTNAAVLAAAVALVAATGDGTVLVAALAGWPAGIAIPFAADLLSALLVAVGALLVTTCLAFAAVTGEDRERWLVPLALVLSAGFYGSVLTADLFNLFVLIEVALIPSYVLLTLGGGREALRAGRVYVTVNLLGSTLLLTGVALLYGVTGTVNLAELAGVGSESGAAAAAGGVVLVALAVKAAVVPVHGWLPASYPHASPAVTALFSGLLTKIGVYALFRLHAVLYDGDTRASGVVLAVLLATMVVGVLGALGEQTMRAILTFHMVSQVGYILLGLAFFGPLGVAAGIFYYLHHTVVKASLFLSAGAVEHVTGTGRLDRLGGLARGNRLLALVFLVAALSLVGIPPLSGFFAKYVLVQAAFAEGQYLAGGAAVVVSLFTLLSMMKVWNGVFWGEPPPTAAASSRPEALRPAPVGAGGASAVPPGPQAEPRRAQAPVAPSVAPRVRPVLVLPAAVLAAVSLAVGLGAEGVLRLAGQAAAGLVDTRPYVEAVLGSGVS